MDRNRIGILVRKCIKVRNKLGWLMCGSGNVYSDCLRILNGVERNEDSRGRGIMDRCWDLGFCGGRNF